ncbi:MerR family transcriptional regulator [Mangrovicoccus ximenensis]|uniref:MerR family transcriptional regulator n=1 Tax=Mangrovicoccus ximenensis TaxID=1911570 RepID=UPI00191C2C77|nr:MerR family transcriptional regulator [Mangrovicoccus ximenensis]
MRADRDAGSWRDCDETILVWIACLDRLKITGMPIREMLRHARLRAEGDHAGTEQRALPERYCGRGRAHLADPRASLVVLDAKIGSYAATEQGTQNHGHANGNPAGARRPRA